MAEFSWDSVVDALNTNNVPEILLIIMGLIALVIVAYYRDDKESTAYKLVMILGVAIAVFMVYVAMSDRIVTEWSKGTLIVLTVACFTLIIRPIRNVNIAAIVGLIVAIWVYLILPDLVADVKEPFDFIKVIGEERIPRLIVSIVAGAIVFTILQFIQAVVQMFGKILNAWPFLAVIGIWCIVEGIFLIMGYSSTYDFIAEHIKSSSGTEQFL